MNPRMRCLFALALLSLTVSASAQDAWPAKTIRVIVPFAPASGTDTVARAVFERMSKALGQAVVIENRPGAGGTIGAAAVARADADGYTLLVHSNSHTVTPATYRNLSYDAQRDLTGVMPLVSVPMVMVTSTSKGLRTLADVVAAARSKPGSVFYGSAGTGGATHLGAERLRLAGNFTATHVPFKGSAEALTDVIAERVDFYFSPIGLANPFLKQGKLTAVAVSSAKRSAALPDVPTIAEAGIPNSEYEVWIGLFAPSKTPRAIINRLNEEATKALRSPELQERFAKLVMDPMIMSVDEFSAFLKKDFELNAELVKAAGIQPN